MNPVHCCFLELVKLKNGYEQGVVMNHPVMNSLEMECLSAQKMTGREYKHSKCPKTGPPGVRLSNNFW